MTVRVRIGKPVTLMIKNGSELRELTRNVNLILICSVSLTVTFAVYTTNRTAENGELRIGALFVRPNRLHVHSPSPTRWTFLEEHAEEEGRMFSCVAATLH